MLDFIRGKGSQQTGEAPVYSMSFLLLRKSATEGGKEMLSRDCDGCSQMKECNRRYYIVEKGSCVYCPDGTAHLVDGL